MIATRSRWIVADEPVSVDISGMLNDFGEMSLKDARQIRALNAFARLGKVGEACTAAGIQRWTWNDWKKNDPAFNTVYQQILEITTDELEMEGLKRATDGSDQLLMFFLKTRRREKYGDRHVIEVVSPDVQSRLVRQADAIMQLCAMELPEPYRTQFPAKLAAALREVWS